jgi:hypothetical protein
MLLCQPKESLSRLIWEREKSNGNQVTFSQKIQPRRKLEEEIQRPPLQQEGERGSTHRDAPHAVGQASGKEPQAGDRDWAFQSAEEGREGAGKKLKQEEGGLVSLWVFCFRTFSISIPRLL